MTDTDDLITFDFNLETVDKHLNTAYAAFEDLEEDNITAAEVRDIYLALVEAKDSLGEVIDYCKRKHKEFEDDEKGK